MATRRHPPEVRAEALRLCAEVGPKQAAATLRLPLPTIKHWVREQRRKDAPGDPRDEHEKDDVDVDALIGSLLRRFAEDVDAGRTRFAGPAARALKDLTSIRDLLHQIHQQRRVIDEAAMLAAMMKWRSYTTYATERSIAMYEGEPPPPEPDGYTYWQNRLTVWMPGDTEPPPDLTIAVRLEHAKFDAEREREAERERIRDQAAKYYERGESSARSVAIPPGQVAFTSGSERGAENRPLRTR